MVHALTLLLILLFGARAAAFIPLSVLAAILFVVAWHMGEWREIPELLKHSWADRLVWKGGARWIGADPANGS